MWILAPRQLPPARCAACHVWFTRSADAWAVPWLRDRRGRVLWYAYFCAHCTWTRLTPGDRAHAEHCG